MTKAKSKSKKTTVKAATAKASVTKSSAAAATATPALIVLGFDEQQKPRGAKFVDAKRDLVTKAADLMGLKVYEASPPDVAEAAKKLPLGSRDGQPQCRSTTEAGRGQVAGCRSRCSCSAPPAVRDQGLQRGRCTVIAGCWARTRGRWRKADPEAVSWRTRPLPAGWLHRPSTPSRRRPWSRGPAWHRRTWHPAVSAARRSQGRSAQVWRSQERWKIFGPSPLPLSL